jgi:hypothetical protein
MPTSPGQKRSGLYIKRPRSSVGVSRQALRRQADTSLSCTASISSTLVGVHTVISTLATYVGRGLLQSEYSYFWYYNPTLVFGEEFVNNRKTRASSVFQTCGIVSDGGCIGRFLVARSNQLQGTTDDVAGACDETNPANNTKAGTTAQALDISGYYRNVLHVSLNGPFCQVIP